MIRKTFVALALTAGMVAGSAGVASAHECFIAKRSEKGNAGASHSANWYTLEVAELYAHAHVFLGGPELGPAQVQEAVRRTAAAGVPTSFTVFEKLTIPRSVGQLEQVAGPKSADGKGVDHFFVTYGDTLVGIYFSVAGGTAP
jgi:hypothetical protein